MNNNNREAVKYLFETYSPIDSLKIQKALGKDYSTLSFNRGNDSFDELSLKEHMMHLYVSFFYQKYEVQKINDRVAKISQSILDMYRDLQIRLDDALSYSRAAAISDKSNADIVKTIYYTPMHGYNNESSTAMIDGGKVIGQSINNRQAIDSNASKIYRRSIKSILSEPNHTYECIIKNENNIAISDDEAIINSNKSFTVEGSAQTNGQKEIELIIDRQEYIKFNNISISTPVAYIYSIYTSEDGVYYEKLNDKQILTSKLNLSIKTNSNRFVKIVVHFSNHTTSNSSGYVYRYEVDSVYIKMEQYYNEAIFETSDINIDTIGEYIAIDTCDNYQDRGVYLSYELNIDDEGWKSIKPVRKASIYQNGLRSVIPISDYQDMKVGVLTDYSVVESENIFNAEIPNTLINSNSFKFFDRSNIYSINGNYITVTGILYKDTEHNFKDLGILVNGTPAQGNVKLFSGVNTIDFPISSFKELFNINNVVELEKETTGAYKVKFANDEQIYTFIDNHPDLNAFSIAIDIFGHKGILGKEITESIRMENTDDYFKVAADKSVKKIYILMRNRLAKVDKVKLRLTMRSIDTYTRPEMTRIIFRVA